MNILLIGSGGREHALAWKIKQSPLVSTLFCAPGNPGIEKVATCVALDVTDHAAVTAFCKINTVTFVVVGPEVPLVAGLVDDLNAAGLRAFGPRKFAAQLEGSKGFTKDICRAYNIPTAAYGRFNAEAPALAYLEKTGAPIVIKADGLAAGKGVTVAMTMEEAQTAVKDIFAGRFGGASCVIEEFLEGEEASLFVLCDGTNILPLYHGTRPQARWRGRHRAQHRRHGRLLTRSLHDQRLGAESNRENYQANGQSPGRCRPPLHWRALCGTDLDQGRPQTNRIQRTFWRP